MKKQLSKQLFPMLGNDDLGKKVNNTPGFELSSVGENNIDKETNN